MFQGVIGRSCHEAVACKLVFRRRQDFDVDALEDTAEHFEAVTPLLTAEADGLPISSAISVASDLISPARTGRQARKAVGVPANRGSPPVVGRDNDAQRPAAEAERDRSS